MKIKLFFILLIAFISSIYSYESIANELVVLKINEIFEIKLHHLDKINLDKKDVLAVKESGSKLMIQGKKEGVTHLRIGTQIYKIVIVQDMISNSYLKLSQFMKFSEGLSLDFYNNTFQIEGRIKHASTWLSLRKLNLTDFKLQTEISSNELLLVEHEINQELSSHGFYPIHILTTPYPVVKLNPEASHKSQLSEILMNYGLTIQEDAKKIYADPLIRVQVTIAEIRKSFAQSIGVEWPNQMSAKVLPQGLFPGESSLDLQANFLAKQGNGRILASPVLLAKSGSEAEFFAGGEFPITSKTKHTQSINWKKYGLNLKIKPQADSDGKISLDLKSEVSSIDSGEKIDGIPSLFTNTISSHIDLHSSQTIALSGLIKKVNGESLKMWPGIGDIPILGGLFTSREYQEDRTELVVLVTPVIVQQE